MSDERPAKAGADNPACPSCGEALTGQDLENLECPGCGKDLPPRLGI